MKKILRRKSDERDVWSEEMRELESSLIIPPCDLWHESETANKNIELEFEGEAIQETVRSDPEVIARPQGPGNNGSQCWAFMGAMGGVGTTSLAVQFAYELSKQISQFGRGAYQESGPLVCLIDLDFECGRVSHYLDLPPGISHEDLQKDAAQIDEAYAGSLFVEHKKGISLLAAPNKIGANAKVNPAVIVALLEIACEKFPYVILDLPQHWQSWSLPALGGSDFIGLVSDFTIPSLNAARLKRAEISHLFNNEKSCDYLLNKYERRYLKSSIKLSDAKKALKSDVFGTISFEPEVAMEAMNCGEAIGVIRPSSRIVKDCETLLDKILELTHDQVPSVQNQIN